MCGIVGFISSSQSGGQTPLVGALQTLLVMDTLRGFDSTGVFWENKDPDVGVWYRTALTTGGEYVSRYIRKRGPDSATLMKARFAVGHNRAATVGGVTSEAAQPVIADSIVGVHNGTISSHRSAWPDHVGASDTCTLYNAMSACEPGSKELLEILSQASARGSFSLVWHDQRDSTLNFARNNERPMWWLLTDKGYLFGSEPGMLMAAVSRESYLNVEEAPFSITEDMHVSLPYDRPKAKPRARPIPEYRYPSYAGHVTTHVHPYGNQWSERYARTATSLAEYDVATLYDEASMRTLRQNVGDETAHQIMDAVEQTVLFGELKKGKTVKSLLSDMYGHSDKQGRVCVMLTGVSDRATRTATGVVEATEGWYLPCRVYVDGKNLDYLKSLYKQGKGARLFLHPSSLRLYAWGEFCVNVSQHDPKANRSFDFSKVSEVIDQPTDAKSEFALRGGEVAEHPESLSVTATKEDWRIGWTLSDGDTDETAEATVILH